jgi:hypothetical protein
MSKPSPTEPSLARRDHVVSQVANAPSVCRRRKAYHYFKERRPPYRKTISVSNPNSPTMLPRRPLDPVVAAFLRSADFLIVTISPLVARRCLPRLRGRGPPVRHSFSESGSFRYPATSHGLCRATGPVAAEAHGIVLPWKDDKALRPPRPTPASRHPRSHVVRFAAGAK